MSKKNWKDLFIGSLMIGLSAWLFFSEQYTLEIGVLLGLLTLWWLEFFQRLLNMKEDKLLVRLWYFCALIVVAPILYTAMFVGGVIENIKKKL